MENFGWGVSANFGVKGDPLFSPKDIFAKFLGVCATAMVVRPATIVSMSLRKSCFAHVFGWPLGSVSLLNTLWLAYFVPAPHVSQYAQALPSQHVGLQWEYG